MMGCCSVAAFVCSIAIGYRLSSAYCQHSIVEKLVVMCSMNIRDRKHVVAAARCHGRGEVLDRHERRPIQLIGKTEQENIYIIEDDLTCRIPEQ
jgi:hypothetical protein